ncbi:MAG TPA: hypothetical protein VJ183_17550 [Chloroflexia bacterium]|nr:hypothetical protein [Chloroflexia bacterium]
MRRVPFMVMVAMVLLALTSTLVFAHDAIVTLTEQNGSGQNGMAELTDMGDGTTMVVVEVTSNGTMDPQPAHIHEGTCANLNPKPAFPLSSVVDGRSETIVPVDIHELTDEPYAINIHKSATEAAIYTSCGDILAMEETPGMPTTGNGQQELLLGALALLGASLLGVGVQLARRKA